MTKDQTSLDGGSFAPGQSAPQRLVDDLLEGQAGAALLRLELGRDVVIEGQRRPHILMLCLRHHDVNVRKQDSVYRAVQITLDYAAAAAGTGSPLCIGRNVVAIRKAPIPIAQEPT